jgi:cellulose synthase/poly-beta-1,6-N-acetylglucosamine synthase-like glycosyltransferase
MFEVIPGALSWGIIIFFITLAVVNPVLCAILIIIFDFYWIIRTVYLTTLLVLAYRKLHKQKYRAWIGDCQALPVSGDWKNIFHLVIFPVYKETPEVLMQSLESLRMSEYPKDRLIVVMAYEERNPLARKNAAVLEDEFRDEFFAFISTFHPDKIQGEKRTKGANATWAAKRSREFLDSKGIPYENTVVSCFDSDTCVDPEYFACLTYHFLTSPDPHKASYQPIPVYNNNIWQAPSFARIVEISASFCQLIESMRLEKFVTFSSHSMSFKTLVDIDYWPVDMISDDSVIYWKAFIYYDGDYRVVPLYITVSMDAAYSSSFLKTIAMQYKQKRRWAWGVENFPYVACRFLNNSRIPLFTRLKRAFNLLESHVTWAVWAVILVLIGPLPLFLGGAVFNSMAIGYNLPKITGLLFNFTIITSLTWVILSRTILPPRPKEVSWTKNIVMTLEWVIVPFVLIVLGSSPALDAQTRMMLARYMEFNPTQKHKEVV